MSDAELHEVASLAPLARPLAAHSGDETYQALRALIGDARLVLIGEASHGSHEFYAVRARLSQHLIAEHGFTAVAAEADWPDAYRVNRFVRSQSQDRDALEALDSFTRFPVWMWRNPVVHDFVVWLRARNEAQPPEARAGFYGLDLYALSAAVDEVLRYLDGVDPEAARRARERYSCFEHFRDDPQRYAYAVGTGQVESCEDNAVGQLVELQRRAAELAGRDGPQAQDDYFYAQQNARLAANAEEYYRSMFRGRQSSWNLRDTHMAETLDALLEHLGPGSKAVVWAHNSHLGDARATEMGRQGELNLGQLLRERYGDEALLIGFSTHSGSVTAADDWGEAPENKAVRPGLPGSYEDLFHRLSVQQNMPRFWLNLRDAATAEALGRERLQRAIGVIYRPETERRSHYFYARLPQQFDALIHIDETRALEPLERVAERGA